MNREKYLNKNKHSRSFMKRWRSPLVFLIFLLMFSGAAHADTVTDTINYKLQVVGFGNNGTGSNVIYGEAGDTIAVPILIQNQLALAGFLIRFTYPSTVLEPVWADNCPSDTCGGFCCDPNDPQLNPDGGIFDSVRAVERGLRSVTTNVVYADLCGLVSDTFYSITARHFPNDDSMHANVIIMNMFPTHTSQNSCEDNYFRWQVIGAGPLDTVARVYFRVRDGISPDAFGLFVVRDFIGSSSNGWDNQFADSAGQLNIKPIWGTTETAPIGYFDVGDPGTGGGEPNWDTCTYGICQTTLGADTCCLPSSNRQPVVTVANTSYTIDQGTAVSFTVNATDADGDFLTLLAIDAPTGANITPSNPVTGNGSASMTFNWTPSFSQSGTYSIIFRATDENNAVGQRTVSITVNELDIDRLFSTSAYGAKPVGGIPGATPVAFPIDLVSSRTVYGIQFDMIYPYTIAELDSIVVTDRTPEYIVYENIGDYPDSVRIAAFGLQNEPIVDVEATSAILNAYFTIDSQSTPEDYPVYIRNAWESASPNPAEPGLALLTDPGIIQVDRYGDVNLDKQINVADLVNVVAYIIGNYGLPVRNFATADVVIDDIVNVVDLIGIVNLIFGRPIQKGSINNEGTGEPAKIEIEHDDLFAGQLTKLNVKGEFPENIAGVQLQIDYNPNAVSFTRPELTSESGNFILGYDNDGEGRLKVLLYTQKPWELANQIKAGISSVLNLPAQIKQDILADDEANIRITQAYLSSPDARKIDLEGLDPVLPATFNLYQNYPNPFNPTTKIDFDISHGEIKGVSNVKLDVFNVLGQKVKTLLDQPLGPGTYTVEWDGKNESGSTVATGIYLYRLKVGDKQQSKKMVLLK